MKKAGKVLVWLALVSIVAFVALAIGRNVHAHLLAFPMLMLGAGVLLLHGDSSSR